MKLDVHVNLNRDISKSLQNHNNVRIGDAAAQAGLTARTIRHYEKRMGIVDCALARIDSQLERVRRRAGEVAFLEEQLVAHRLAI